MANQQLIGGYNGLSANYGTMIPNRIFVGGISTETTEADLCTLFSQHGKVKSAKIILDQSGVSKGYGFVTFETREEARRIQIDGERVLLGDRKLNIAPAFKKCKPTSRGDVISDFGGSSSNGGASNGIGNIIQYQCPAPNPFGHSFNMPYVSYGQYPGGLSTAAAAAAAAVGGGGNMETLAFLGQSQNPYYQYYGGSGVAGPGAGSTIPGLSQRDGMQRGCTVAPSDVPNPGMA